jgi:hypothetical protein
MLITVKNPFDGTDIEIELFVYVNGTMSQEGLKTVHVQAQGTKEV